MQQQAFDRDVLIVLHDVAHPDEFWIACELIELGGKIWRAEIDPAHDSFDDVVLAGKFEEPAGLFECLASLHGDGSVELLGCEKRFKIVRQEVAAQRSHAFADPAVVGGAVHPEVLMSVQAHTVRPRCRAASSQKG